GLRRRTFRRSRCAGACCCPQFPDIVSASMKQPCPRGRRVAERWISALVVTSACRIEALGVEHRGGGGCGEELNQCLGGLRQAQRAEGTAATTHPGTP